MIFYTRQTAGLGNTAIYARLRNASGEFWDFVSLAWVTPIISDCKIFLAEYDDDDVINSFYSTSAPAPSPTSSDFIKEIVLVSDNSVLEYSAVSLLLPEIEASTVLAMKGDAMALTDAFNPYSVTDETGATNFAEWFRDLRRQVIVKDLLGVQGWDGAETVTVTYSGAMSANAVIYLDAVDFLGTVANLGTVTSGTPNVWTKDAGWTGVVNAPVFTVNFNPSGTGESIAAGVLTIVVSGMGGTHNFVFDQPNYYDGDTPDVDSTFAITMHGGYVRWALTPGNQYLYSGNMLTSTAREATVTALPTLAEIEASSVLAKEATLLFVGSGVTAIIGKKFNPLSTGIADSWPGIAVAPNGNVYAARLGGDIYMQTAGEGPFVGLNQQGGGGRSWEGMTATAAGHVYVTEWEVDIHMQTNGTGDFLPLSAGALQWSGIAYDVRNGDVYACVYNGNLWKQTSGIGPFVDVGEGPRAFSDITIAPNGDFYIAEQGVGILCKKAYGGGFENLNQVDRNWTGLGADIYGNVYATEDGGDIYMRYGGVGDFVPLGQEFKDWQAIAGAPNGDIYASVNGGDIWEYVYAPSPSLAEIEASAVLAKEATFLCNRELITNTDPHQLVYRDGAIEIARFNLERDAQGNYIGRTKV